MNKNRIIEKMNSWPVTIALCLLIIAGTLFVKLWPRTVPFDQCSEEYKRYADVEGIEASFVKDFRINDTLCVDVTVLKALDSNFFNMLKSDFNIQGLQPRQMKKIENGEDIISHKAIFKTDSTKTWSPESPVVALLFTSFLNKTVTIFHIKDESEERAIVEYNYPFLNPNKKK